jgi:hypothetical protein
LRRTVSATIAVSAKHRRHLTAEQKRDLIAKLHKAKPEFSKLQIADGDGFQLLIIWSL